MRLQSLELLKSGFGKNQRGFPLEQEVTWEIVEGEQQQKKNIESSLWFLPSFEKFDNWDSRRSKNLDLYFSPMLKIAGWVEKKCMMLYTIQYEHFRT